MILKSKDTYLDLSKFSFAEVTTMEGLCSDDEEIETVQVLRCYDSVRDESIMTDDKEIIEQFQLLEASDLNSRTIIN